VVLVVVPAAQVDRLTAAPALGEPHDVDEEAQRRVGLGRQQLDMGEVRKIEGADGRLQGFASVWRILPS
jgi:hypothetical protein